MSALAAPIQNLFSKHSIMFVCFPITSKVAYVVDQLALIWLATRRISAHSSTITDAAWVSRFPRVRASLLSPVYELSYPGCSPLLRQQLLRLQMSPIERLVAAHH